MECLEEGIANKDIGWRQRAGTERFPAAVVSEAARGPWIPVLPTERRVWLYHAAGCCYGRLVFGKSEVQPIEPLGRVEEPVILHLCQDLARRQYADIRSLMAFQMVAQFLHLLGGEIPRPPDYENRCPSQEMFVLGELHSSPWDSR